MLQIVAGYRFFRIHISQPLPLPCTHQPVVTKPLPVLSHYPHPDIKISQKILQTLNLPEMCPRGNGEESEGKQCRK